MKAHLLIVEDDIFVQRLLAAYLEKLGYRVSQVETGKAMFEVLERESIDLVTLDLNLPDEDGLVLARKIRTRWTMPIIVLSARSARADRIAALELGADDYITKPADPEELALRVRNQLNRSRPAGGGGEERIKTTGVYRFGEWTLDVAGFSLTNSDERPVTLTPGEFRLLATLVKANNRVLSRDQLLDAISGTEEAPGDRLVDVLISRLRKKIEKDPRSPAYIVTVVGVGYKFAGKVE